MTKNNIFELAKQGDQKSIIFLIEDNLKSVKIAKYEFKDGCLKLVLESEQVPNQQESVSLTCELLAKLDTDLITKVIFYGKKIGDDFPEWNQEKVILKTDDQEKTTDFKYNDSKEEISKNEFLEALQTFEFSSVFPYHQVLNPDLYRSNLVRLLLFFGLFPWAVSAFAGADTNLKDIAWMLGIYYACVWGIVLFNLIKPTKISRKKILQCVLFTAFIGIPILIFIQQIPPFSLLYSASKSSNVISKLIGYILGIGLLEELCKGLPIYLFMLNPGKLKEPLTSAFYGAMSGLGFAIAEGVHYSLIYANNVSIGNIGITGHILLTTVRFISLPLIHAIWAGIVGYFLGLAAINPSRKNPIIFIGVAISAVLHGAYNTFSSSILGLVIFAFSILLFVTYIRNSKEIITEMQQFEARYQKNDL